MTKLTGSAAMKEINAINYAIFASALNPRIFGLEKLIYDESIYAKFGKEYIDGLIKQCKEDGYLEYNTFLKLVRRAFGNHAVQILKDRPHLNIHNIENFKVFDKKFYDVMGENFVHQLLNFDYSLLFGEENKEEYDEFLSDLLSNDTKLNAFKYCFDYIVDGDITVYDYSKLILTFKEYGSLFMDMFENQDKLTCYDHQIIRNIIARPKNLFNITSTKNLLQYDKLVKEYFDAKMSVECLSLNKQNAANVLFERFFGINPSTKMFRGRYKRSVTSIDTLMKVYNIDRLIALEENPEHFNRERVLSDGELAILKLISAIGKICDADDDKSSVDLIQKLYNTLDAASLEQNPLRQIIQVSDSKYLFDKIPKIYYEDLKNNLTDIDALQKAVDFNEEGIKKIFVNGKTRSGKNIQVPVYILNGHDYFSLITTTNCDLNQVSDSFYGKSLSAVKNWFEIENGIPTISCSTISYISKSLITSRTPPNSVTFMFGKNVDIVAMGCTDVFTSAIVKDPDTSADSYHVKMFVGDDFDYRSSRTYYNEIVIERYSADETRKAGRIIPEAIFQEGKSVSKEILGKAIEMTEYLIKNGLKPKDYVFPIVILDRQAYSDARRHNELLYKKLRFSDDIDELSGVHDTEDNIQKGITYIKSVIGGLNQEHKQTDCTNLPSDESQNDSDCL